MSTASGSRSAGPPAPPPTPPPLPHSSPLSPLLLPPRPPMCRLMQPRSRHPLSSSHPQTLQTRSSMRQPGLVGASRRRSPGQPVRAGKAMPLQLQPWVCPSRSGVGSGCGCGSGVAARPAACCSPPASWMTLATAPCDPAPSPVRPWGALSWMTDCLWTPQDTPARKKTAKGVMSRGSGERVWPSYTGHSSHGVGLTCP